MTAVLLKGTEVAKKIGPLLRTELTDEARNLQIKPSLALIQIGMAQDAALYAKAIRRVMTELDIQTVDKNFGEKESEETIVSEIQRLGKTDGITGVLILSPVPPHLDYVRLTRLVPAAKDVEGAGDLTMSNLKGIYPPTALAVLELIQASEIPIEGKDAVVIGRSRIVGQPVAKLLLQRNATVTICHSRTANLQGHVERADILVACAGKPALVDGSWVKRGSVVIDAAENVVGGKITGDVEFEKAKDRAAFITPVPAGVGPLTTYMLGRNLLSLLRSQKVHRGNL